MGAGIAFVGARAGYRVELIEPRRVRATADASISNGRRAGRERRRHSIASNGSSACPRAVTRPLRSRPFRSDSSSSARSSWRSPSRFRNDALLATNTSSLSVDELADVTPHPERVLGLHFFNPAPRMKLVEVVRGDQTSDEAIERAAEFVARFGKTAVSPPTRRASSSTAWLARTICRHCARSSAVLRRQPSSTRSRAGPVFAWGRSS